MTQAATLAQLASSGALSADTSGNVGVGGNNPGAYGKLGVLGSGYQAVSVQSNDASGVVSILASNSSSETRVGSISNHPLFFMVNGDAKARIDTSGGLILAGSTAQKATGTTWSNPSDQRLKNNIRDYTKGTAELMQVRVKEWEYNGKGGTTDGMKGLGVVADEVMEILPNTVDNYEAKLNSDDEETTEIKKFDATEITWLLVNAIQEQQTIINDLKARITALEGAA